MGEASDPFEEPTGRNVGKEEEDETLDMSDVEHEAEVVDLTQESEDPIDYFSDTPEEDRKRKVPEDIEDSSEEEMPLKAKKQKQ